MMVSALENEGYRVWTVGDDIAWMQVGSDGYLHAINPEAGFFGVAPGTNEKTNPNVMAALRKNTIFTNVGDDSAARALVGRHERQCRPPDMVDWQGRAWIAVERPGGAGEFTVHRAGGSGAFDFSALGGSRRRADLRIYFWRPPRASGSPGVRSDELAARRLRRRDDGVGNDRGDHRRSGRHAARSDGHAALLRLQHGRLFRALARNGAEAFPIRRRFST